MSKLRPMTPLFDPDPRHGALDPGIAPPSPIGFISYTLLDEFLDNTNLDDVEALAIADASTLVAVMDDRLTKIDISDPSSLSTISSVLNAGALNTAYSVAVAAAGTPAYVGGGANLLSALNVSVNPPTVHSTLGNSQFSVNKNIAILDASYIAVPAQNDSKIHIMDISNPASMSIAGTVLGHAFSTVRYDPTADLLIAVSGSNILIIDVSVRTAPTIVGNLGGYANINGLALTIASKTAWVTNTAAGKTFFTGIDYSTPATPAQTGSIEILTSLSQWYLETMYDTFVAAVGPGGTDLRAFNCSAPSSPAQVDSVTLSSAAMANGQGLVWYDGVLYIPLRNANTIAAYATS